MNETATDEYARVLRQWAKGMLSGHLMQEDIDEVTVVDVALRFDPEAANAVPDDPYITITIYYQLWSGSGLQWVSKSLDVHDTSELVSTLLKQMFALATPKEF